MKDSFLEKLGIMPGPWDSSENNNKGTIFKPYCISEDGDVDFAIIAECTEGHHKLIAAAPEILEALIDAIIFMEDISSASDMDISHLKHYKNKVSVIEKATGKSWEEIKEIYENL